MKRWLEEKKREAKKLQGIIRSLKETPIINPEGVDSELFDLANEYIVCCRFKIACEEDEQILKMNAHINDDKESIGRSVNDTLPVDEKESLKKVRETLRHFVTLKSIHRENNSVKFLATDEPLAQNYGGDTGAFLYFYEDGVLENEDLRSWPRPNNLRTGGTGESTLQLSWDDPAGNNTMSYKVEYKKEASTDTWSSAEVKSGGEGQQTITLSGLEPATKYVIRVCTVLKIIVSEYSEEFVATTKPASPPGKPELTGATSNSLTISFAEPQRLGKDVQIINYKVEWSDDTRWTTKNVQHTKDSTPAFSLERLYPSSSYFFQVTANCGVAGESNASPSSEAFSTTTEILTFQPDAILGLCKLVKPPEDNKPAVYALPLTLVDEDRVHLVRRYDIHLHDENAAQVSSTPNKVIMMVGSIGSGKTTTVNAMINYVLGVKWQDCFRFKISDEDSCDQETKSVENQSYSQTKYVTCYTLPYREGFQVNIFSLVIFRAKNYTERCAFSAYFSPLLAMH